MPPAFRAPARPDRAAATTSATSPPTSDSRSSSSRPPVPAHQAPSASTRPTSSTRRSPAAASTTAPRSPSRSSSTATRGSTTRSPSTAASPSTSSPTTTPTCSKRCGRAGSRRSSSRPTASMPRATASCVNSASGSSPPSASARRRRTWSGSPGPRVCTSPRSAPAHLACGPGTSTPPPTTIDIYREWANAIVHGRLGGSPSRQFAAGMIALRPERDGAISGYDGVDELQRRHGEWVDRRPPSTARARRPNQWRPATWPTPGCACAIPTTTRCAAMLDEVGRTVRVRAG